MIKCASSIGRLFIARGFGGCDVERGQPEFRCSPGRDAMGSHEPGGFLIELWRRIKKQGFFTCHKEDQNKFLVL